VRISSLSNIFNPILRIITFYDDEDGEEDQNHCGEEEE
jgi:hypothetical protein